ncbi:MAG: SAM-dependent methyltransferase [Gemmatimonadetes bacterium]|nr:SAM-dependent methyltransferase [Gemmatimonadota bacterium]
MNRQDHWEAVFREKRSHEVSWFQERPGPSLELVDRCDLAQDSGIIDVGAGASNLVDELQDRGFLSLGALDLSDEADRVAYKKVLGRALCPGGYVILATFGTEGPSKCSGLDVVRYSPDSLQEELGPEYVWLESLEDPHQTPSGKTQAFIFSLFRRVM